MAPLLLLSTAAALAAPAAGQLDVHLHPLGVGRHHSGEQPEQPAKCPDGHPDASVDLPSPLPSALETSLQQLRALLETTVNSSYPALSGKPHAAALRIDYRGQRLWGHAAGDRDPKARDGKPDEGTIFRIGSVSKLFPVLMLYQLYDRGIVRSLDDPLSAYAPGFQIPNVYSRSKRQFTLRQLASQLSGLPREAPCDMRDCNITTAEVIERLKRTPGAQWPEYTQASYSNLAYALLGNVLAEHVGMSFPAYVQQHILDPLGMQDTGFAITEEVERRMARSYVNETRTQNYDIGFVAPAGQMYSSLRDLAKLGRYYLGLAGELFDDGLRRELLAPSFLFRDGDFLVGSPWEMQFLSGSRWLVLGKAGNLWGYSATFSVIPALNLSLSALWSGQLDTTPFLEAAYARLLPGFLPALEAQRPPPRLPREPAKYVGDYRALQRGVDYRLEIRKQALPGGGEALAVGIGLDTPQPQEVVSLNFHDDRTAVLGSITNHSCFAVMASAQVGAWLTFELLPDGEVASAEMPGSLYGVPFRRAAAAPPRALLMV